MRLFVVAVFLFMASSSSAGEADQFQSLLDSGVKVRGVVFEILGGNADSLRKALIRVKGYAYQLRGKNNKIDIIVVSRGLELFSLLKTEAAEQAELHGQVEKLVHTHKIPIQVCGRFASMKKVRPEEFIDSVEVLPSAPVRMEEYRLKGYRIIQMDFPKQ